MAGNTKPAAPQGTLVTGSNTPAGSNSANVKGTSWSSGTSLDPNATSPYYTPSTYNVYQLTQTSPQDITSIINSAMQQLVGRNATADEIQMYGAELLQAERQNQGKTSTQTTYQTTGAGVGKKGATTGTATSRGVDPSAFIQTLIQGTADAGAYKAATGYFQAMMQSLNQFKGAYNG